MSSKDATLRATFTAVDKVSKPLSAMNKNLAGVRKALSGVRSAGANLGSSLAPIGLATAAVTAFAVKSVKGFLDTSGALQDMSERLGVSAEALQEWQYVADKNGVESEALQGSMEKLNKTMYEAAAGKNKEAAALFKKLGINLKDNNGHMRTSADIMPELADGFQKNTNATVRTAMAQKLMGKTGGAMVGVLSQGSAAIKAQQDEARKLGLVLSDADVAAADAFSDEQLGKFQKQLTAIQMTIGSKLLPVLGPLVQQMSQWLGDNRVQIADGIAKAAAAIGDAIKNTDWQMVGTAMKFIFGGMMLAQVVSIGTALYGVGAAIATLGIALAPVLVAFAPIIIAVGLLGAAAFLLYKNWDGVIGGLKALWENFSGWITPKIEWVVSKISGVGKIFSGFGGLFGGDSVAGSGRGRGAVSSVLPAGGQQKVQGDMVVRFENAPPGMRAEQGKTNAPGFSLNPDVGYRSQAWG